MPARSFGTNLAANLGGQLTAGILAILSIPWLVGLLGPAGYGLVGLFIAIQTWFTILDLGFGQALLRQTARLREGAIAAERYWALFRTLQVMFAGVAVLAVALVWSVADWLATDWLNTAGLPVAEVELAIRLMVVAAGLRWMQALYRGVVVGSERFVWFGAFQSLTAVARFPGAVALLYLVDPDEMVVWFMGYQAVLAAGELTIIAARAMTLARSQAGPVPGFGRISLQPLKRELGFSLSLSISTVFWLAATQSDRIVLSGILPLDEYGIFSVAVVLAGSIAMISQPLLGVVTPRLSRLAAAGDEPALRSAFVASTATIAWLVVPPTVILVVATEAVLQIWTGDTDLSSQAAPIVQLYALGNCLLAMNAMGYQIQFARGRLRLHLIGTIATAAITVPAQIVFARAFGGVGAGAVWVTVQVLLLALWLPVVLRQFLPGIYRRWLWHGVLVPGLSVALPATALAIIVSALDGSVWLEAVAVAAGAGASGGLGLLRLKRGQEGEAAQANVSAEGADHTTAAPDVPSMDGPPGSPADPGEGTRTQEGRSHRRQQGENSW